MHFNHQFRRVFDLNSAYNERASPRAKLISDLYGFLDMDQSIFSQNRFYNYAMNVSDRDQFPPSNKILKNNYSSFPDEIKTATLIPVVHLPSNTDYSGSSRKSSSLLDSSISNSTQSRRSSEAEVDALTNILIKSIGNKTENKDPKYRGYKSSTMISNPRYCNKRVFSQPLISTSSTSTSESLSRQSSISLNECHRCCKPFESTVSCSGKNKFSVEQINGPLNTTFHQACFSCYRCEANLNVDSFFYAQKRLLCSRCVHESLEKCTTCNFIINDRIIRILGYPYHPKCFTCTVCNSCLDGQPFTVDVHERMFCLDDFHKRYAPRCDLCGEAIRPQNGDHENKRIISGDKTFHMECSGLQITK